MCIFYLKVIAMISMFLRPHSLFFPRFVNIFAATLDRTNSRTDFYFWCCEWFEVYPF